ncbi:BTAD domain-containing putative transcriptional regulator [Mycolicibacterium sediminis]|uniref:OmpR/PhoB-type domain-containing protein n=1 Tax=Mycolicibacterium sediminis TaxID=1286180 RepID=A0A7I7QZ41_9MYCO|nr:BTAD domain-containing putative transcriptional regulator [Mycolicibacterium sediminis]BBY31257.1 hypothetical protein MSEDJ_53530 [Mycolicibacterium sediminis]
MEYRILGPLAVRRDGLDLPLGGLRQRAVLAVLLLSDDRAVEVDRLIEQVWGDEVPAKPLSSLRAYVANLRRIIGTDGAITRAGQGYRLDTAGDVVDVREFARLIAQGRKLLDVGDAAAALPCLDEALGYWRGTPLADFRNLNFAMPEVHRLDTMRADAVELRFETALRLGVDADLIADLESEVGTNPLRESLWALVMLAMYRSGRRIDALRAYERASAILDTELGVRPGVALQRLATDIRNESAALDWQPPVAVTATRTPERGGDDLFGRSSEVRRMREALDAAAGRRGGVIVLTGDSGMGKTALAHCVADMAGDTGMATAWAGHASDIRRPPSWAWAHALRELAAQLPQDAGELHAPLPDWWSVAAEDANAQEAGAAPRFAALEAIVAALAELVSKRPALIVLDDLQLADRFTHDVLAHIASAGRRLPLVIVATWQDGAGSDGSSKARALERLRSRTDVEFVKLRGLGVDATADLIGAVGGVPPQPEFTVSVQTRTGGNPFYIRELIRLLVDDGRIGEAATAIDGEAVPEAVSGVIRTRLAALPTPSRAALYAAAVSGAEFTVGRVAAVTRCSVDEAIDALTPARLAGLVTESSHPAALRFSHGLVRDAIAGEISGVERARLHADVARTYVVDLDEVASQDAIDGAHHGWSAGTELDAPTALRLLHRARADAWSRSAYREVAELDRRALDVCSRLPAGAPRFETEIDLQLQLASVEAVVSGQSSAKVLQDLRRSSDTGKDTGMDAVQSTTSVAMGCLEACGTGRYYDAAVLSDSLVEFFGATGDPIAGSSGHYIRALTDFMRGNLDRALDSVTTLHSSVPPVDWEQFGALASFEVLAHGVAAHAHGLRGDAECARSELAAGLSKAAARRDAFGAAVLRTADVQLAAMTGVTDGVADRADRVVAELTEMGVDQFIGGARLIRTWARAMGPEGIDGVDDMRAALELHGQGGRRIFTPLYLGLCCDVVARHRDPEDALLLVARAETVATSTGEHVWDAQLSARRLRLTARRRAERPAAY